MKSIDNLIESLQREIRYCGEARSHNFIKVCVASQNVEKVRLAVASVNYELRNGKLWDRSEMSEAEINARCTNYIQDLYLSFNVLVEIMPKPWPNPAGDFLGVDTTGFNKLFFDLEDDANFIETIANGVIDDPALLPEY